MVGAVSGIIIVSQVDPIFEMPAEFANYPVQPSAEYMVRSTEVRLTVLGTGQRSSLFLDGLNQLLLGSNEFGDTLFHESLLHVRNIHRSIQLFRDRVADHLVNLSAKDLIAR